MNPREYDVAIVGAGPVGLTAGVLLGMRGHRVAILERFKDVYHLPRAVSLDADVMRIFQSIGIVDELSDDVAPVRGYRWLGADGKEIVDLKFPADEPMGWTSHYTVWQPALDAALDARAMREPTVDVLRGVAVEDVIDRGDDVFLSGRIGTEETRGEWTPTEQVLELVCKFVIGADGANSVVRSRAGIEWIDLGFNENWLVVDVLPTDSSRWPMDTPEQLCDPRRPTTQVPAGPRHRRWEFMCMPNEKPEELTDPDRVWALLKPYIAPAEGRLVRSAVYEFRSLVVRQMRTGRIILAGDSAHLMPPFIGQGMCSGIRDAGNLAWRLHLMLRGVAPIDLLDAYDSERRVHSKTMIDLSVQMGRVSCTIDPVAAAERDSEYRSGEIPPPPPSAPGLEVGTFLDDDPVAGELVPQGTLLDPGSGISRRADDLVGGGRFLLVHAQGDPRAVLSARQLRFLETIDCETLDLEPGGDESRAVGDDTLDRFLRDRGIAALVRRPDCYGYGSIADIDQLPRLIDSLQDDLSAPTGDPDAQLT